MNGAVVVTLCGRVLVADVNIGDSIPIGGIKCRLCVRRISEHALGGTIPDDASKGLTECWRNAMAAKPSDWRLMGVACGPREVDPKVHSAEDWCAWARGPDRERLEGRGSGPGDALLAVTVQLRELSG